MSNCLQPSVLTQKRAVGCQKSFEIAVFGPQAAGHQINSIKGRQVSQRAQGRVRVHGRRSLVAACRIGFSTHTVETAIGKDTGKPNVRSVRTAKHLRQQLQDRQVLRACLPPWCQLNSMKMSFPWNSWTCPKPHMEPSMKLCLFLVQTVGKDANQGTQESGYYNKIHGESYSMGITGVP